MARLEFAKMHLEEPAHFWNTIFSEQIKPRLHQNDGERKRTDHDPNHLLNMLDSVMDEHVWLQVELGHCLLIM